MLDELRHIILESDSRIVEEQKWRKPSNPDGVPVWSYDGIICIGNVLKGRVRLTFARGASLRDPKGLFNTRLDSKSVRAIDVGEDARISRGALRDLVHAALALNASESLKRRR